MDMLSNGYGCIKKRSKTLKQSLFDWMLHKFNSLLIRTMSDVPTASTSTSTSSSSESTSQESASFSGSSISTPLATSSLSKPNECPLVHQDLDCTTDDSESSSEEESETLSTASYELVCTCEQNDLKHGDDVSWTSASSTTVSCAGSDNSDTEKTILKDMISETWSNQLPGDDIKIEDSKPVLILVQMKEIGIDIINVEEHTKRLNELENEIDYIESTEWMYRPIDSSIR